MEEKESEFIVLNIFLKIIIKKWNYFIFIRNFWIWLFFGKLLKSIFIYWRRLGTRVRNVITLLHISLSSRHRTFSSVFFFNTIINLYIGVFMFIFQGSDNKHTSFHILINLDRNMNSRDCTMFIFFKIQICESHGFSK